MVSTPQPGQLAPAPQPLALVQDFVNTLNREAEIELFADAASLRRWLRQRALIGAADTVTERDLRDAVELREAIRAILLSHNGESIPSEVRGIFDRYGSDAPLGGQVTEGGMVSLAPVRAGVPGAWAELFAIMAHASADGTWSRLKACRDDRCNWVFYDNSKNRTGHWCSMQLCGSRSKMRRYRERNRARH
jgi:predicted RNA-binding Zn ribbon-like protein